MSNTEGKFGTWFQNKSANESNSDTKRETEDKKENNENELDLKLEKSRTEKEITPKVLKKEIKWHKRGEDRLWEKYSNKLQLTLKRQQKFSQE